MNETHSMNKSGSNWLRLVIVASSVLLLLAALTAYWVWLQYRQFPATVLLPNSASEQTIMITPGSSYMAMVRMLGTLGEQPETWLWRLHGRLHQPVIHAGEYLLRPGTTVSQWLHQLSSGAVVQHAVTVVEGTTSAEIMTLLQQQSLLDQHSLPTTIAELHQQLLQRTDSPLLQQSAAVVREQQLDERALLEGMLLPETYFFVRDEPAMALLQRMHSALLAATMHSWQAYVQRFPDAESRTLKSPYQLLILASIIEKETGVDSEREQIAGVFHRRLQRGMLLQTDPTVIYGLAADYDGNIRRRDLTTDTAYNTYTRKGLPPAPIANAGAAAIAAAGHPAAGESLYFVASGDGGHVFSNSLQQHQRAVQSYLRKLRERRQP